MHFMTIVVNSIKYKFFFEKGEYWVEYADNDYIHYTTREELDDLLKLVFSSDINYSHIENGQSSSSSFLSIKEFKEEHPNDYYQSFLELVNAAGPEYKILLNATINDNKEIFNVLSNPTEGIDYFADTEDDSYELYKVDGVYTIFSNHFCCEYFIII